MEDDKKTDEIGYTHDDIKKESLRDIIEQKIDEPEKKEEVIVDDTAQKKEQEDLERVKEEERVRQEAEEAEKQKELDVKKEELSPDEKAYEKWEGELWEKEKRQPTYTEALEFVKTQAKTEIQNEQELKRIETEEAENKVKKQQEEDTKRINTFVDDELSELYNSEKLTRIKDASNPSDQGVVERKALFAKWAEVNDARRAKGQPEIISPIRIFDFYYQKPQAQPAGADAPIAGNKASSISNPSDQAYTYADIKKPWNFFRAKPNG